MIVHVKKLRSTFSHPSSLLRLLLCDVVFCSHGISQIGRDTEGSSPVLCSSQDYLKLSSMTGALSGCSLNSDRLDAYYIIEYIF